MRILVLLVCALAFFARTASAACGGSAQVWNCTAGSTVAQIQTAVDIATDGATITFATGNYSWSSSIQLSNDKGVTLICASAGACTVTVGTTGQVIYFDSLSGNNSNLYRISGFRFQNGPASGIPIWFYGAGTMNKIRIDHNTFQDFGSDVIAILFGETSTAGKFYGVIDNNTLTGANNIQLVKVIGHSSGDNWGPSSRGTANNLYIENNALVYSNVTNLGSGCMDGWRGAAVVWRYNSVQNCLVTAHGVTHGGFMNFEIYKNSFARTANSGGWEDGTRLFHHQGSGECIVFDNIFSAVGTKTDDAIGMTHYRSADPGVAGYSGQRCDGTASIDGNRAPSNSYYGYPCWRQPGRDGSSGLQPMYVWNNRWSDTAGKLDMQIENPWGQSNPSVTDHIKADRDYYNAVSANAQSSPTSPFNGTTGMGFGTLANRPVTCTTNSLESGGGVGYFATDQGPQGTLYRCSTTNTWTVQYTPYLYPHPLRNEGGGDLIPPSAPSNLRLQ